MNQTLPIRGALGENEDLRVASRLSVFLNSQEMYTSECGANILDKVSHKVYI
jgi:hypothetical protein